MAQVDISAIATFSSTPEATLSQLLQKPTTDLVRAFLESITPKAIEHKRLKTEKAKTEIELEATTRSGEAKRKQLETQRDRGLAEIDRLRTSLQAAENARITAEREAEQTQSAITEDAAEVSTLQARVATLEASNRDTLGLLHAKVTAYDNLAEDLSSQQSKVQDSRRQISELEQKLQSATSAASSQNFRLQSLTQELDLAQRNAEWVSTELKTKTKEHHEYRREKSSQITKLQQSNEDYISQVEALKRSETALHGQLEDYVQKLEDSQGVVQGLRDEAIQAAEAFRIELDTSTRLAELQKSSADTAKKRAHELSLSIEELREDAGEEIGRVRAEIETEHADRVAAEERVTQLEAEVSQLEAEVELAKTTAGALTPRRPSTPGIFSPSAFSPSIRGKGTMSMTQLFSEYKKVEKALHNEKRRAEQLSESLDEMVETVEKTQPEIDELRADHSKMQAEMVEISRIRDSASKERDQAVREARRLQGEMDGYRRQRDVLQQQVRDTSSQIKVLLLEQHLTETGQQLSQDEMEQLHRAAVGDEDTLAAMGETGRIVSENLTVFRNIIELTDQNGRIHSMLRTLGEQMEAREAADRESSQPAVQEELQALRAQVASYKDELRNMVTQSNSYIKERDMFRGMLTRRQPEPAFAQSLPLNAVAPSQEADYGQLLKDLQHHFDSYKQEAAADNTSLKTQLADVTQRNAQLQAEVSKQVGLLSAASSRAEILQANYNMLKIESQELQKRSEVIRDNASKQEFRTQAAAEEMVEVRGQVENLYRETANLKAEKDLWKSVESRLVQDTEDLRNERSRMESLNSTLQHLLNEREQADSESSRRMQRQVESLEVELASTKRKLNDEIEDAKKTSLRREYDHEQSQKRIDDLMASLAAEREEGIRVKASRDHLQARVDELVIELRSAEERVTALLPKDTGDEVARQQELVLEISELKRDLELKQQELDRLNEQVETFKQISQSSEERLQELSETQDLYREDTDRALEDKNGIIAELEGRVLDISTELTTTNNELSRLRDEQSTIERRLSEQKASSDQEVARLKQAVENETSKAAVWQADVQSQAKIAADYQQNYEDELQKHADAAKTLSTIRSDYNKLREEAVQLRTSAETSEAALVQREESWSAQKARYEKELQESSKRRADITQQNTLLHKQLEDVSKQISSLKNRNTSEEAPQDNMQEVVQFLRREKEIVDVQLHLSAQESKRVKQQLDHAQAQLDETRLKLDQQLRANADTERNTLNHNKLMETLNELNLYRESSVTLRAEAKRASTALAEKTAQVETLEGEMEPLASRIAELENLSELREGEMKLLQQDRDHWQERTQNILAKYDRVDPQELETLKQKLASLETERDEAVAARDALQAELDEATTQKAALEEQVGTIPAQVETAKQDLRARLTEQFKARNKEMTGRVNAKQAELDAAMAEKAALELRLQSQEPQTNGVNGQDSSAHELQSRIDQLAEEIAKRDAEVAAREERFKTRETELKAMLNKRLQEVKAEAKATSDKALLELEEKLRAVQSSAQTSSNAESDAIQSNAQPDAQSNANSQDAPAIQPEATQITAQEGETTQADALPSLTDEQIRILLKENEIVRNMLRANIRKAVDKEKEAHRKVLEELQGGQGSQALDEAEKRFAAEKEALVKEMEERFDAEKKALLNEQENRIASARQDLIIKQQEAMAEERATLTTEAERKAADQINLAEKRTAAKLNLATNQAKNAAFKLGIIKEAAEQTPQEPVVEVWNKAKDARPPAVAKSVSAGPPSSPVAAPAQPVPASAENAKPAEASAAPEAPKSESAASGLKPPQPTIQPNKAQSLPTPTELQDNSLKPVNNHAGPPSAPGRSMLSQLPRRGGQRGGSTNEASQPAPAGRGSAIPRGSVARRGTGRGGALNPEAGQFVSAKRGRDDEDGRGGKRLRGPSRGS